MRLPDRDEVERPDGRRLALLSVRRTLGVSALLFVVYVGLWLTTDYPLLSPTDLLTVLGLVFVGTWLGIAFSFVAPLPASGGLPRVIRTTLLVVPALGIGVALQIFLKGAESDMAIYAIFALAAWLGSTFVRERPGSNETGEDETDADGDDATAT